MLTARDFTLRKDVGACPECGATNAYAIHEDWCSEAPAMQHGPAPLYVPCAYCWNTLWLFRMRPECAGCEKCKRKSTAPLRDLPAGVRFNYPTALEELELPPPGWVRLHGVKDLQRVCRSWEPCVDLRRQRKSA